VLLANSAFTPQHQIRQKYERNTVTLMQGKSWTWFWIKKYQDIICKVLLILSKIYVL